MNRRSTFVVFAALLGLAGCGSQHAAPPTGDALATAIRSKGLPLEPGTTVGCAGRTCTVAFKAPFDTARVAWLTVGGVVWSIEADNEDDHLVKHLTVLLGDPQFRRVAVFSCNLGSPLKVPSSIDFGTTPPSRLNCVDKLLTRA